MASELTAGQIIAGRYLLGAAIGEGAMGAVFRAEDQTLKREVAIKFLFVKATRNPQAMVDQFLREARIAASVQHRNVIQTVDFGTFDQYQPFMVMELLNGESLGERMERQPGLTREQLVHIVSLTLRGLAAVHDAGIVHRDLKPQNIFLQRDADAVYPKILDFGISRSVQRTGERPSAIATQEGLIVGTPDYMSPEQARGESTIDLRSDIYSMAVILYEGLARRLPFEAETVGDLIVQIMTQEPPRLHQLDPSIPRALSDLVAQAMAKNREQRFADARAMRRALLGAAEQLAAGPVGSLPPLGAAVASEAKSTGEPPPRGAPGAATWGDFEGLNAPRIVDKSIPPVSRAPSLEPASKNQQRVVVQLEQDLELEEDLGGPPPLLVTSGSGAVPPRKSGAGKRASAAASGGLDVALDPLYAGADRLAPDIDYGRAGMDPRKAPPRPTPRARVRPLADLPAERVRYKRSYWPWLLPGLALVLLGYLFWKPSGPSLPQPQSPSQSQGAAQEQTSLGSATADADLKQRRLLVKGRRQNPGQEPPHMRDVVF